MLPISLQIQTKEEAAKKSIARKQVSKHTTDYFFSDGSKIRIYFRHFLKRALTIEWQKASYGTFMLHKKQNGFRSWK